jgi:uncharacterized membrane protein YphA (DoxX/SURF4 family)
MEIAVWIVSGVLALGFVGGGAARALLPLDRLSRMGWPWASELPRSLLRTVGGLEVAGGLGLVLPVLTGILPILTPIAACCLALVMVLAIAFHVRRRSWRDIPVNAVFAAACLFVAVARFAGA